MHNFRNEIAENFMNSTEFNTQVTPIHSSIYGSFYEISAFSTWKNRK